MSDQYPQYPYNQGGQQPYPGQPQQYGQPAGPYGQAPGYGPYGQPGYGQFQPPPENHLVWGILTTIFCCLPFGIVSIVKASQVSSLWAAGQFQEAQESADQAKKWAIWSAATVGILFGLYVLFILVMLLIVGVQLSEVTPS